MRVWAPTRYARTEERRNARRSAAVPQPAAMRRARGGAQKNALLLLHSCHSAAHGIARGCMSNRRASGGRRGLRGQLRQRGVGAVVAALRQRVGREHLGRHVQPLLLLLRRVLRARGGASARAREPGAQCACATHLARVVRLLQAASTRSGGARETRRELAAARRRATRLGRDDAGGFERGFLRREEHRAPHREVARRHERRERHDGNAQVLDGLRAIDRVRAATSARDTRRGVRPRAAAAPWVW